MVTDIALIDKNKNKVKAEVMDLREGLSFVKNVNITGSDG